MMALPCLLRADDDSANVAPVIGRACNLIELFTPYFVGLHTELAIAAGFDSRGRLLSFVGASGTADSNSALIPLVRAALRSSEVVAVVIAHNHPDGDMRPSASDIATTRRVAALCRLAGAALADHFLFANGHIASFRNAALL